MSTKSRCSMIYICGDSFSVTDHSSGQTWVDMLEQTVPDKRLINLSVPGASNYLIYLQVKHAISNGCEHIIYQSTSSIRHEFIIANDGAIKDSYARYHNAVSNSKDCAIVCGSWHNLEPHHSNVLSNKDATEIRNFSLRFFDLASAIEKNYIYIIHTLNLISGANLKSWAWSRGGFEHKNFKNSESWDFSKFKNNEISVNLWDHYDSSIDQPVYHITDPHVHRTVCNHYLTMLQLHNDHI